MPDARGRRAWEGIARRQRARLADIVSYARAQSTYYRELYRSLPMRVEDPTVLPVTDKKQLMGHFDDVVTDREVTLEKVRAFISHPDLIGEHFLDRYTALTTSDTSGMPGIFVRDDRSMAVITVLALRTLREWLRVRDVFRIVTRGRRITMVCATGGHYAEAVAGARLQKRGATTRFKCCPRTCLWPKCCST